MKNALLFITLSAFFCTCRTVFAQTSQESLREDAQAYFQANENSDWEAVTDMLYPKLFDLTTREQMIENFRKMESEGFKMSLHDMEITDISEIDTHQGQQFALLDYEMKMDMILHGKEFSSQDNVDMMLTTMKNMYGEENVQYSEDSKTLNINASNSMIALAEENSTDWKFLEYNDQLLKFLNQILPEGLVEKIKKKAATGNRK